MINLVLLLSFDLPRFTKEERKQANQYRKRLVELGFKMKQFSLYEREVLSKNTRDNLVAILKQEIPDSGLITLYLLPNEVNEKQITILGDKATLKTERVPHLIVL